MSIPAPVMGKTSMKGNSYAMTWITLKEGFLYKTKKVKKGFHKSTKLRYFMLKQDPLTRASQLEYYEGQIRKGILPLKNTEIKLLKAGSFMVIADGRETELATEQSAVNEGMRWVLALQQAANSTSRSSSQTSIRKTDTTPAAPVLVPPSPFKPDFSGVLPAQSARIGIPKVSGAAGSSANAAADAASPDRRRGGDEELDGQAIDDARWVALRKGWERANRSGTESEAQGDDDDDEDNEEALQMMREMEEEEERRQEEERVAWLAEREKSKVGGGAGPAVPSTPVTSTPGSVIPPSPLPTAEDAEQDPYSEDEDDWMAEMQAQEEAEAKRQEEERLQWLAEKEAKKTAGDDLAVGAPLSA